MKLLFLFFFPTLNQSCVWFFFIYLYPEILTLYPYFQQCVRGQRVHGDLPRHGRHHHRQHVRRSHPGELHAGHRGRVRGEMHVLLLQGMHLKVSEVTNKFINFKLHCSTILKELRYAIVHFWKWLYHFPKIIFLINSPFVLYTDWNKGRRIWKAKLWLKSANYSREHIPGFKSRMLLGLGQVPYFPSVWMQLSL